MFDHLQWRMCDSLKSIVFSALYYFKACGAIPTYLGWVNPAFNPGIILTKACG